MSEMFSLIFKTNENVIVKFGSKFSPLTLFITNFFLVDFFHVKLPKTASN